jgi:hypothetical protein
MDYLVTLAHQLIEEMQGLSCARQLATLDLARAIVLARLQDRDAGPEGAARRSRSELAGA